MMASRATSSLGRKANAPPTILLFANTSWYLWNFRLRLAERLALHGFDIVFLAPRDAYSTRLQSIGRFVALDLNRQGIHPGRELATLLRLIQILRRERPDAILSWTPKCNIYGALAGRLLGLSIVPNVSGLGTGLSERGLLASIVGTLYRSAFKACTTIFFQNRDDLDHFRTAGWINSSVGILLPGSGVDLHRFAVTPLPLSRECRFLFAGRLLAEKGLRELASAMRRLKQENAAAQLRVAGFIDDGNPTGLKVEEIRSWEREGILEFVGPTDKIEQLIADADCVVLPSFYREGLPRILLEAAACGRPVITTDAPGCREAVIAGKSGLLCKPRDVDSLHAAMATIAALGRDERAAMGAAGRRLVEESYSDDVVLRAYEDCLAHLEKPHNAGLRV